MFQLVQCMSELVHLSRQKLKDLPPPERHAGKIVGGHDAKEGEIPFQVSWQYSDFDFHFCGGSILDEVSRSFLFNLCTLKCRKSCRKTSWLLDIVALENVQQMELLIRQGFLPVAWALAVFRMEERVRFVLYKSCLLICCNYLISISGTKRGQLHFTRGVWQWPKCQWHLYPSSGQTSGV